MTNPNIFLIICAGLALFALLYGWMFYVCRDRSGRYPSFDAEQFNRKGRR